MTAVAVVGGALSAGSVMAALSLETAATVLGVAGLLGAALAVVLTSWARQSLSLLRETNGDLVDRMKAIEGSENNCQARLAKIEAENGVLRDMVTGQSAIAALGAQIEANYRDLLTRLANE